MKHVYSFLNFVSNLIQDFLAVFIAETYEAETVCFCNVFLAFA